MYIASAGVEAGQGKTKDINEVFICHEPRPTLTCQYERSSFVQTLWHFANVQVHHVGTLNNKIA